MRVPDIGRFELRLMDGATNPYLAQAGIIAAGLDGIENKRDAGEPLDLNMYDEKDFAKAGSLKKLPTNLLDALRLLDKNIGKIPVHFKLSVSVLVVVLIGSPF